MRRIGGKVARDLRASVCLGFCVFVRNIFVFCRHFLFGGPRARRKRKNEMGGGEGGRGWRKKRETEEGINEGEDEKSHLSAERQIWRRREMSFCSKTTNHSPERRNWYDREKKKKEIVCE